jgi:hypothetical protein
MVLLGNLLILPNKLKLNQMALDYCHLFYYLFHLTRIFNFTNKKLTGVRILIPTCLDGARRRRRFSWPY